MEVVKSLRFIFIFITLFAGASLLASRVNANCQAAKSASDTAQRAMESYSQGTQGGNGVPTSGQGTANTTCQLGNGLQGVGQPAQQAAQQCMQQCQQCPEDPDGQKGLKPTCNANASQCGVHMAKAMQALAQAASAMKQCKGSEDTSQSAQPPQPPQSQPPKEEQQTETAEQKCAPPMIKDPATGACKSPEPTVNPDVITKSDLLKSINIPNGGTSTALIGPTVDSDDDKIVFASEGLDPVRAVQRRTAIFQPDSEDEELGEEGEELNEDLQAGTVGVPVLKDLYAQPKAPKSAVRKVASIAKPKAGKKKPAFLKTPEELQKEELLKAVLDPRHNVNPFVNIERESEKIQKLIAKKNFCEASSQIHSLSTSTDIHSQMAAAELQKKLDAKLDANQQPIGEFGISMLCNN